MTGDYTDIDKLRDEALEAVEGALVEMLRGPWAGDTARSNAAMWAPGILAAAWPERNAVLAEVDQLRTDNERLREFIMTEREKCSFDGPLPTGSWPDVALQLIRHLLGRRDALQAEVRQLRGALSQERDRCNQHTEDAASLAALQARIDAAMKLHVMDSGQCWHCDYEWPCPTVAALGVDPQKEEQQ